MKELVFQFSCRFRACNFSLKSTYSRVFFKDFAKILILYKFRKTFLKQTLRNSLSVRWIFSTIANGLLGLMICRKELHFRCSRAFAAFDLMCFVQDLFLHYFFYHFKYICSCLKIKFHFCLPYLYVKEKSIESPLRVVLNVCVWGSKDFVSPHLLVLQKNISKLFHIFKKLLD